LANWKSEIEVVSSIVLVIFRPNSTSIIVDP
jgi:hypothetical protein